MNIGFDENGEACYVCASDSDDSDIEAKINDVLKPSKQLKPKPSPRGKLRDELESIQQEIGVANDIPLRKSEAPTA